MGDEISSFLISLSVRLVKIEKKRFSDGMFVCVSPMLDREWVRRDFNFSGLLNIPKKGKNAKCFVD